MVDVELVCCDCVVQVGSVDDNRSGGSYAYRASKSALNNVNKSLSIDLAADGISSVLLHPGGPYLHAAVPCIALYCMLLCTVLRAALHCTACCNTVTVCSGHRAMGYSHVQECGLNTNAATCVAQLT